MSYNPGRRLIDERLAEMFSKVPGIVMLVISLILFTIQGCELTKAKPLVDSTSAPVTNSTDPLKLVGRPSAGSVETADSKDIITTTLPTTTTTATPVPPGTYALYFYSPLAINYDPLLWEKDLRSKTLTSCFIGEQGPTDFNGPHTIEIRKLGVVNYQVLSFPELANGRVSNAYIADEAFATEAGLPGFWVIATPAEWEECKALAEDVLATLRFP